MRVNFNYFVDDEVVDYIVEAVRLVARLGWRLLGDYRFDPLTGLWHHRQGPVEPPLRLADVGYAPDGTMTYPATTTTAPAAALPGYLQLAEKVFELATPPSSDPASLSADFDQLRWFELPACSVDGADAG